MNAKLVGNNMFMRKTLRSERGVALILVLGISSVLCIVSAGIIGRNMQEGVLSRRYDNNIKALYEAERGVGYAFIEAKNAGFDWITHEVDTADIDGDGDVTELIKIVTPPNVTLTGSEVCEDGNYTIASEGNSLVEVKIYKDPDNSQHLIVLSRSTDNNSQRIIKFRIDRKSLFEYLFFFPSSASFSSYYDGGGLGGIHVNGNLNMSGASFRNLTMLEAAGYIYYGSSQYTAPYSLDDAYGSRDGKACLHYKLSYPPYTWQYSTSNLSYYPWHFNSGASISNSDNKVVSVPQTLNQEWQWDKYSGNDKVQKPGGKDELPVTFEVPSEVLAMAGVATSAEYWKKIYPTPPYWMNREWYDDLTYGNDRDTSETTTVKFTNSRMQPVAWKEFLSTNKLDKIVYEKNTGAQYLTPLNLEVDADGKTYYAKLAQKNGLYIGTDTSGNLDVWLNGEEIDTLPSYVQDNVQFFNAVRPKKKGTSYVMENVIQVDVSKVLADAENTPGNNIVYVDNKDLRLVNAKILPEGGLTVVSPYNVYVKGNYNYDPGKSKEANDANWQPAALITNSLVYTLSDSFNDPQTLPVAVNYPNYPYSLQYQEFLDKYCAEGRYPSSLIAAGKVPPGGVPTWSWVKSNLSGTEQLTLLNSGEGYYDIDNDYLMANRATTATYYNTAIAGPNAIPVAIERWGGTKAPVKGSFVQLEKKWSTKYNNTAVRSGNYISNPTYQYYYETRFGGATGIGERPSGDMVGGAQSSWQEVNDFDHHS